MSKLTQKLTASLEFAGFLDKVTRKKSFQSTEHAAESIRHGLSFDWDRASIPCHNLIRGPISFQNLFLARVIYNNKIKMPPTLP